MSAPTPEPETLISGLSHRPRHLIEAMITITDPPQPSESILPVRVSSVGTLDCLPPEIMSIVSNMLDIQSLTRLSGVSYLGYALMQLQPKFRELVRVAPQTLVALVRVGLAASHSVDELHRTLHMEKCAICPEYGPFLFLPSCQRSCWECLRQNPSFRLLRPSHARTYFGLGNQAVRRLPILRVIPGKYDISSKPAPGDCKLVSVKAARALGLAAHHSAERLREVMNVRCRLESQRVTGAYLQSELSLPKDRDFLFLPGQGNVPPDSFFGMACVPFPSISNSGLVEDGIWCRGCELTVRHFNSLRLPQHVLTKIVPANCEPNRVLVGLERRAWSKESFLNHVKECYGAQKMISELTTRNE